ncbi:MAG: iron-sulfur cluster assembly scaffold protein [Candidatus Tectomicrobia bacterium]|uniref:Iron-sulfur cluster assembly scaffold protein n=1 Tax=Tectimicrobiota bacterium TaxID=2528274 RepID=A0A937VYL7_UNCTE|nr:iron-sulfur cluster assembly scaffold protein [Candidatus Tectomicrobia bacterium]
MSWPAQLATLACWAAASADGETLLEHFRHPRNHGVLPAPDVAYEDVNPLCGDRIRRELQVNAKQRITAVRFRGDACIISRAAASLLTEVIQHWTLQQVARLSQETFLGLLHTTLRPSRVKCALLPLQVVHTGIAVCHTEGREL